MFIKIKMSSHGNSNAICQDGRGTVAQIKIYQISYSQIWFGTVTKITDKIRSQSRNFARTDKGGSQNRRMLSCPFFHAEMSIILILYKYFQKHYSL